MLLFAQRGLRSVTVPHYGIPGADPSARSTSKPPADESSALPLAPPARREAYEMLAHNPSQLASDSGA